MALWTKNGPEFLEAYSSIVQQLMDSGADPEAGSFGDTPLKYLMEEKALWWDDMPLLEVVLIEKGCQIQHITPFSVGFKPFDCYMRVKAVPEYAEGEVPAKSLDKILG